MSNPCFEIWLILHLKDVNNYTIGERLKILENKSVSNKKNHIDVVLGDLQGAGYSKNPNPEIFLPLTRTAVARAKGLDILNDDYPKDLGSHLYKLIEKLIKD